MRSIVRPSLRGRRRALLLVPALPPPGGAGPSRQARGHRRGRHPVASALSVVATLRPIGADLSAAQRAFGRVGTRCVAATGPARACCVPDNLVKANELLVQENAPGGATHLWQGSKGRSRSGGSSAARRSCKPRSSSSRSSRGAGHLRGRHRGACRDLGARGAAPLRHQERPAAGRRRGARPARPVGVPRPTGRRGHQRAEPHGRGGRGLREGTRPARLLRRARGREPAGGRHRPPVLPRAGRDAAGRDGRRHREGPGPSRDPRRPRRRGEGEGDHRLPGGRRGAVGARPLAVAARHVPQLLRHPDPRHRRLRRGLRVVGPGGVDVLQVVEVLAAGTRQHESSTAAPSSPKYWMSSDS